MKKKFMKHPKLKLLMLFLSMIGYITTLPFVGLICISKYYIDLINYLTEPFFNEKKF